jgi:hypothetical protein
MHKALAAVAAIIGSFSSTMASADELQLPADGHAVIRAELGGQTITLRVDLDAPNGVMLNPDAAARLGLRGGLFGARARVGPVMLRGSFSRKTIKIGGRPVKALVVWFDRNYATGIDGVISPALLPYDLIRFAGSTASHGQSVSLPVTIDQSGITTPLQVGGGVLRARFSLSRDRSATNASGGQEIGQSFGARAVGAPRDVEIAYGVERPMQHYSLLRPLPIGSADLRELDVRVTANSPAIASDGVDPDEIVVTAHTGKERPNVLTVGRDALGACSSITLDRRAKKLTLECG